MDYVTQLLNIAQDMLILCRWKQSASFYFEWRITSSPLRRRTDSVDNQSAGLYEVSAAVDVQSAVVFVSSLRSFGFNICLIRHRKIDTHSSLCVSTLMRKYSIATSPLKGRSVTICQKAVHTHKGTPLRRPFAVPTLPQQLGS